MSEAKLTLGPGEAHLFVARVSDAISAGPALLEAYARLMSPEERERHGRFYFERHRNEFLLTRALARGTLSRYLERAPRDLSFEKNEHGCPRLAPGQADPPLRFNLSNTDGLVAMVVSIDRDVGVDVEHLGRRGETVSIADRFFAPPEVEALRALPESEQRDRFFAYWTLKESYIKAREVGLGIPLAHFAFDLSGPEPTISFDPRLPDDPSSWRFSRHALGEHHVGAVALRRRPGEPLRLSCFRTLPLAWTEPLDR